MQATPEQAATRLDRRTALDDVRELMLGWCLWLLGSWGVTLTLDTAIPSTRWMIYAAMTGLLAAWPAVRLSQAATHAGRPSLMLLVDWFALLVILQAVVWPLRVVAGWTWWQALWIDLSLGAWALLAGGIAALGRAFAGGLARTLAMVAVLIVPLGEPAVALLAGRPIGEAYLSPIDTLHALMGPLDILELPPIRAKILVVAGLAGVLWMLLIGWWVVARRR